MNGKIVMDCIDAAYASIKEHAEEIMVLDQSIGDDAKRVHPVRAGDVGELREIHLDAAALAGAVHIMK